MTRSSAWSASVLAGFQAFVSRSAALRSAAFAANVLPSALHPAALYPAALHPAALAPAFVLSGVLAGCGGGYPEPRNQLIASEAAVRAAEVAGAQNGPQSALHLKRAREQVESGKSLIQEGENERAEWVLRRAQSDADLALAVATEEARRKQAAAAKTELDQLRDNVRQGNTAQ